MKKVKKPKKKKKQGSASNETKSRLFSLKIEIHYFFCYKVFLEESGCFP